MSDAINMHKLFDKDEPFPYWGKTARGHNHIPAVLLNERMVGILG